MPPLPGQESASQRLPSVTESEGRSSLASADADSGERGRLFVKVVGVKDLGLPIPQGLLSPSNAMDYSNIIQESLRISVLH